uniref:hypothetical protein n=1 Tax=Klebsiella pneumoniae TaxID=573 RepID=UPI0015EEB50D|nr:hypothetical protein [Klebsiella pneumoniae]
MGSCAAPSAKGDDKFITTDYLQQCHLNSASTCSNHVHPIDKVTCRWSYAHLHRSIGT